VHVVDEEVLLTKKKTPGESKLSTSRNRLNLNDSTELSVFKYY